MKSIGIIFLALAASTYGQVVNITNQQERAALPTAAVIVGGSVFPSPSFTQLKTLGWRYQHAVSNATAGFVAIGRTWVDDDGTYATAILTTRTQAEQDDLDAAAAIEQAAAVAAYKDFESTPSNWSRIERAAIELLVAENNTNRQWISDFKAEVAASTSLADFKSRVAGLPDMPQRTPAQIKSALRNKLDSY